MNNKTLTIKRITPPLNYTGGYYTWTIGAPKTDPYISRATSLPSSFMHPAMGKLDKGSGYTSTYRFNLTESGLEIAQEAVELAKRIQAFNKKVAKYTTKKDKSIVSKCREIVKLGNVSNKYKENFKTIEEYTAYIREKSEYQKGVDILQKSIQNYLTKNPGAEVISLTYQSYYNRIIVNYEIPIDRELASKLTKEYDTLINLKKDLSNKMATAKRKYTLVAKQKAAQKAAVGIDTSVLTEVQKTNLLKKLIKDTGLKDTVIKEVKKELDASKGSA